MAEVTGFRLLLSASEIKRMTQWPDEMVEDYLQILNELVEFANEINQNTQDIQEAAAAINNTNSDLSGARVLFAKNKAGIDQLKEALQNTVESTSGVSLSKIRSALNRSVSDCRSWMPVKGVLLTMEGQNTSNPIITNDYNLSSLVRTGTGSYLGTVSQEKYFGRNVLDSSIFSLSEKISPITESFSVECFIVSVNTFTINTYKSVVSGTSVERDPYDIQAGDFVNFTALFSINDSLPPG